MIVSATPLTSEASTDQDDPLPLLSGSVSPAVVLALDVSAPTQYVGQNAFGVAKTVRLVQEVQTLLLPIADLDAPDGCDFRSGHPGYEGDVADSETMITWACGPAHIDGAALEKLDQFEIAMSPGRARQIASSDLQVAYVVSFDELPEGVSLFKGPVQFSGSQPTLDNPTEVRVIGDAISARLRRVLVYSLSHGLLYSKSYE